MIEKIEGSNIQELRDRSLSKPPACPKTTTGGDGASLQVDYDSYIEKAIKTAKSDPAAVQRARDLLLSGRLDNPQAIRAAAKNIADFGI
jgi:hypothetical protein